MPARSPSRSREANWRFVRRADDSSGRAAHGLVTGSRLDYDQPRLGGAGHGLADAVLESPDGRLERRDRQVATEAHFEDDEDRSRPDVHGVEARDARHRLVGDDGVADLRFHVLGRRVTDEQRIGLEGKQDRHPDENEPMTPDASASHRGLPVT